LGREGEFKAPGGTSVSVERREGQIVWRVAGAVPGAVPQELRAYVASEAGGYTVTLPTSQDPALTWSSEGLLFRWRPAGGGGLFDSDTQPTYPLGPGDKLQITVYNVEDMDRSVIVDPKGYITFPVLDKVAVAGLTMNDLQKKFEQLLAEFVKEPQVNAQLIEYGSRFVNVLGEVQSPGRFPVKGSLRLLDAVSQAGGFTDKSGDVEIQRRDASGQLRTRVILREELLGMVSRSNLYVLDQDVVNVQPMKQVYVSGEVKNPGSLNWYKDLTLLRAVTKQGGFSQWARREKVDILRDDGKGGTTTIRVDARAAEKGEIADPPLMPNDHVVVNERKFL
jgi:polysaccharide export outer membrane protein